MKKTNKTPGFLKRNLKGAPEKVRETASKTMIHPQTEYYGAIWDPYMEVLDKIEMIQCRAARFILRRYHNKSNVSDMVNQLGWETLQARRVKTWLVIMYMDKATHQMIAMDSLLYLIPITMFTHQSLAMNSSRPSYNVSEYNATCS